MQRTQRTQKVRNKCNECKKCNRSTQQTQLAKLSQLLKRRDRNVRNVSWAYVNCVTSVALRALRWMELLLIIVNISGPRQSSIMSDKYCRSGYERRNRKVLRRCLKTDNASTETTSNLSSFCWQHRPEMSGCWLYQNTMSVATVGGWV